MSDSQVLPVVVKRLDASSAFAAVPALAEVLIDCVEGGASVGFLHPLSKSKAEAFWASVAGAVERGETVLWVATTGGRVRGTVQLQLKMPENQPHRAEVAKLQVLREARRGGLGAALMIAAEEHARRLGRTTLVLDTASEDAERLYRRLGWQLCGVIPRYALNPDGTVCDTKVFWKHIDRP